MVALVKWCGYGGACSLLTCGAYEIGHLSRVFGFVEHEHAGAAPVRLADFILANVEPILVDRE